MHIFLEYLFNLCACQEKNLITSEQTYYSKKRKLNFAIAA